MDVTRYRKSPAVARHLMRLLVGSKYREFVIGDLEEEFLHRVASDGLRAARYWYWKQVAYSIFQKKGKSNCENVYPEQGDIWIRNIWIDAKYGLRVLLKKPAFFIAALLALAVGAGVSTAIFSVVNSVILKPLPFPDADRIVTVWENNKNDGIERDDVSPANFLDWQQRQRVFESMASVNPWGVDYTGSAEPETWLSAVVSKGFFEIFGVKALYGRTFHPEEYQAGRNNVVVLNYAFWQRRFGGDPSIIGRTLPLDGTPTTIVGVMPPEFRLYLDNPEKEVFQPQIIEEDWKYQRKATYLRVVAKLRRGVTLQQAQSAMETIGSQLASEHPRTNHRVSVCVVPFREHLIGKVRLPLVVLFASVGFVVLIGCANLANLQLARSGERRREIAVRLAIGANRHQIIRQLMTENLIIAIAGGIGSLLVARWVMLVLIAVGPATIPRLDSIHLDLPVMVFGIGLSFVNSIFFGLLPLLHLSGHDPQETLKNNPATIVRSTPKRMRNTLVITQIAIAIVLLVGAGLFSRSLIKLLEVNPGFQKNGVVALQVFLYGRYETAERRLQFTNEALSRLKSLPGVTGAGVTTALPFFESSSDSSLPIALIGQPLAPGQEPTAFRTIITEDYFRILQIPLLSGRVFQAVDHQNGLPTVIINDLMSKRLGLGKEAIGKKLQIASGQRVTAFEIIGVVGSLRHEGLDDQQRPEFYVPYAKSPSRAVIFLVRTTQPPELMIAQLKSVIWKVDPALPFYHVALLKDLVNDSLTERRFQLFLLGSFAIVALLLCVMGIYGLISCITAQRTSEIGIRMALGAQKPDILRMITGQALRLALAGIVIGIIGAMLLTRFLKTLLFEISALDPFTYVVVTAIILAAAFAGCLLPARRALRINPVNALRYE